jgi:GntR family transcriptional regulator / MocR family aminotransferase
MLLRLAGQGPLHRQVYAALRAAILAGDLPAGARLPSTRELAQEMSLSRTTTQLAYEQLLAEGYVEGRVGSGTYVAADLLDAAARRPREAPAAPEARVETSPRWAAAGRRVLEVARPLLSNRAHGAERPRYDFRHGLPSLADFPLQRWRRHLGRRARQVAMEAYDYGPAAGSLSLREAIAGYLRRSRGLACEVEQIVIVSGSQQGLDLVSRLLLEEGDVALIEEPGYEGARNAFLFAGAAVVAVPVDADGINLAAAAPAAREARLVHVTPSHQYPLGSVMSLSRRLALLEWAERRGAFVVEDDYDGEFRFQGRPLAPLQALDRGGRVIYLGTFSKVMFPALRLGYLVLPPSLAPALARAKSLADGGTSGLEQEALADFIRGGGFERHLRRTRTRMRERREALLDAIGRHLGSRVEVVGADAGLHVLLRLPAWSVSRGHDLARRARDAGVGIYPATPYYTRPPRQAEFVLGYSALNQAQIRLGIKRLAALLE